MKKIVCCAAKKNIFVDFGDRTLNYRRKFGGGKKQLLSKAVGLSQTSSHLHVLDCTAGFGKDAFILSSMGCHVTLLERSSIIGQLLIDGLERAKKDPHLRLIVNRMTLHCGDALKYLQSYIAQQILYDVVYLDPMFTGIKKSANVKKEMQFLRTIISEDQDADLLLPLALKCARYRVVVKRPRISHHLNNQRPSFQLTGKKNRFDVYTIKSLKEK